MADEWRKQDTADGGTEKNERYMEGNYDNRGNIVKRYKQIADDEHQSVQIEKELKAWQEEKYETETEKLARENSLAGEEYTRLLKEYIEEDKYQQYLVDGAVLRCNQATTDDFDYNGGTVVLENKADEVCNIVLDVHENPISGGSASGSHMIINGQRYATVKDAIQQFNINPPKCNCKLAADRLSEHEKIRADGDRNKNGVCRHLMRLNEEWDNYRVDGTEYLKKDNAIMVLGQGEDGQAVQVGTSIEHEGVEGITMTSVLFCKHGGLIMPVTSGQDKINSSIVGVSSDLIELLKKYETGLDKDGNSLPEGTPALYPYHGPSDPSNVLTIGWGHAMKGSNDGWFTFSDGININLYEMYILDKSGERAVNAITTVQAMEILQADIEERETELNQVFVDKKINTMISQQFYDALFLLTYQMGTNDLTNQSDLSNFLEKSNFDLTKEQEIKEQFGEYTNHLELGTMRRRADELDIIFQGTYERDYDEKRYGDIWRKKSFPNVTTPGY